MRPLLLSFAFLTLFGCVGSPRGVTKADARAAHRDAAARASLCGELGQASDCDLCSELGFYADGECDDFCDGVDPGCGAATCGGIAGGVCPDGQICADDPSDDPVHRGGEDSSKRANPLAWLQREVRSFANAAWAHCEAGGVNSFSNF